MRPTILIVDDNSSSADFRTALAENLHIFVAANPSVALQILDTQRIDIIVLDFSVDDTTSIGVALLFKESLASQHIPIIILNDTPILNEQLSKINVLGIIQLPKLVSDDVFLTKILHLNKYHNKVRLHHETSGHRDDSSQKFYNVFVDLCNECVVPTGCVFLLVSIDTTKANLENKRANFQDYDVCNSLLEHILRSSIENGRDKVVKINELKYVYMLPGKNLDETLAHMNIIRFKFLMTGKRYSENLEILDDALNIGATLCTNLHDMDFDKLEDYLEEALHLAVSSTEYFCVNQVN